MIRKIHRRQSVCKICHSDDWFYDHTGENNTNDQTDRNRSDQRHDSHSVHFCNRCQHFAFIGRNNQHKLLICTDIKCYILDLSSIIINPDTTLYLFFLTGGAETPATLCAALTAAGLGDAHALVGENLGTPDEKIHFGTAQELAGQTFASLSVLLVEHAVHSERRTPGLPDEAFIRGEVPMTKQEVRAAALAKLAVRPADTLWDVGAGTGSVSVELALAAPQGHVYAVECEPDACALIYRNREKFAAWNLSLIEGRAPAALEALPAPDAVFIGGTKGSMAAVVDTVLAKNANARICIAAIALESLSAAIAALTAHGLSAEVTQLAVSRTRPAGRLHLLTANNPIFLITGERK